MATFVVLEIPKRYFVKITSLEVMIVFYEETVLPAVITFREQH